MIEPELGAMAKRIVSMTEDRCSDHAVGEAVLELAKMVMKEVIERQMARSSIEATFGRPLTPAERMDNESGIFDGMEWSPEDKQTFVDALADPPAPNDHLWQAADRYGRR